MTRLGNPVDQPGRGVVLVGIDAVALELGVDPDRRRFVLVHGPDGQRRDRVVPDDQEPVAAFFLQHAGQRLGVGGDVGLGHLRDAQLHVVPGQGPVDRQDLIGHEVAA